MSSKSVGGQLFSLPFSFFFFLPGNFGGVAFSVAG